MDFGKYRYLPDSMKASQLQPYFIEFLQVVRNTEINVEEATNELMQLADRQWHTYELIDLEIKKDLESWLIQVWRTDSKELVNDITSVVAYLGLSKVFDIIKKSLDDRIITDQEIERIIQETVEELNVHIDDPYSGMK